MYCPKSFKTLIMSPISRPHYICMDFVDWSLKNYKCRRVREAWQHRGGSQVPFVIVGAMRAVSPARRQAMQGARYVGSEKPSCQVAKLPSWQDTKMPTFRIIVTRLIPFN